MSRRTTPLQDAINHILARRDKNSMLEIKFINSVKGRGIFTLANFKQGDFVVEYRGELIDATEAEHRRNLYHSACSVFMFEFIWKQKTLCIDGALEDGSFGRLVNDEHRTPNCRMKLIEAEGKPHLCLFALKEIAAGSEITYDYGGKEWPWRKKLKIASIPSGQQCVAEPIAHDVEHHVISTDSFTDRELRAECQSSRPTADNSEHECTIHRLVFESVKLDKCGICHSPLTAIRWHGLRCKQCRCVWHKICLQTSSEDWDMSDGDVSSDEEYIPNSASDSESSGTELSIELPGPSKNSHAASMPDLCVTFAEKEQTMDVKNNFEHILNDLETTDDLHPDQEPDSSESCQQKTKDACSEKRGGKVK
ncbi:uncharacterized protein LOC134621117 [Pelmatolapia mariae]|uniref:uncharacterized protein LOC134621117 n=1 Tax=Pelmatolapia mariae TaxID=158779 RepID=UPI002FE5C74E